MEDEYWREQLTRFVKENTILHVLVLDFIRENTKKVIRPRGEYPFNQVVEYTLFFDKDVYRKNLIVHRDQITNDACMEILDGNIYKEIKGFILEKYGVKE